MINKEQVEGTWHEVVGKIKYQWALLTDDDIAKTKGNLEELSGAIQRKYGIAKADADREVVEFIDAQK